MNDDKFTMHNSLGESRGSKEMYSVRVVLWTLVVCRDLFNVVFVCSQMVDFEELFTTEDERRLVLLDREFQASVVS